MTPHQSPNGQWRQEALDVLGDAVHWKHLDPDGWSALGTVLATLDHSVDGQDGTAVPDSSVTESNIG